jgi:hypothetical protein
MQSGKQLRAAEPGAALPGACEADDNIRRP